MSPDLRPTARLRALRLVGFKSFAERTVLEFGPGISAVIGPNGSGKSNLADALRWALGEQGRALRARRSEDVIFAGSARRRATGMADVTLVVDNGDRLLPIDYAEIEFGRRLYRSGESEYLLNRQRVRLRDLTDLLDGANLADNAFLFIGQGMVDQALSLRPEERRPLFEEVAGVRRHERRRRQAEERLEEAERNLARVRDILAELRPQARRLAAQTEQAVARQAAAEALAAELVRSARIRAVTAARTGATAAAEQAGARGAVDEALTELRAADARATALAEQLAARAAGRQAHRAERDAAQARSTEARLAVQRVALELEAAAREAARLESERDATVTRLADARAGMALPVPETDPGSEVALVDLERAIGEASAEAERALALRQAEGEREASLRRAAAAREAERVAAERTVAEREARLHEASAEAEQRSQAAREAAGAAEDARRRAAAARETERLAETALASARDAAAAAEAHRELAAGRLTATEGRAASGRARRDELEARLAARAGGGIVAAARRRGGRLVAEGLEVEPRLQAAVEAALGPALRAAAVPETAIVALRAEHGHLVVETAAAPNERERRAAAAAVAAARAAGGGPLVEAVRRDPGGTVSGLLARALWLPDLEAALAVRAALPPGWLAVTVAGERIEAGGLVRLGPAEALLSLRAEREAAVGEVGRLETEVASAQRVAEAATAATRAARADVEAARAGADMALRQRRLADEQERTAGGTAEATRREAAWAEAQVARLAQERERAAAVLGQLTEGPGAGASLEAGASPGAAATTSAATPPTVAGPAAAAPHAEAWQERLAELRSRRAGLAAQVEAARGERRAAEDRLRRAEVTAELEQARLAQLDARAAELAEAQAGLTSQRSRAAAAEAQAQDVLQAAEARSAELDRAEAAGRRSLAEEERQAAAAREGLRTADERARVAELATVEARLVTDQLRDGLLVELAGLGRVGLAALGTDPGEATEEAVPGLLESAVEGFLADAPATADADTEVPAEAPGGPGRLASLRRRFAELGAGNPFAADEYAELRQHLEDLETQQSDLEQAMEATRRLIAELSERIVEQFRRTFAALEEAFATRFEALFGGGDARLVLTDPDDLAATGVEIMARPPGKKRQALAMLSGGERALTAVALLFAMLEIRPVPFCVLDEVDAALDEANVGRFTAALQDLAAGTQFVVITHNRGTIEAADALYGVTIGNDAVSRVISLRLAEATALAGSRSA